MDAGFPKAVDQKFSGMSGRVTAALQYRGDAKLLYSAALK